MVDQDETAELEAELDEALLALEELILESPEEALSMFDSLPEAVRAKTEFKLSRARALQAHGSLDEACQLCESILTEVTDETLRGDIHHLLGDLLEDLGDSDGANTHFNKVLELDQEMFPQVRHLADPELNERISSLLNQCLDAIPTAMRSKVVTHRVELFPTKQDVEAGIDPRGFSAYQIESAGGVLRIFSANLDAEYGDLDELDEFDEHILGELQEQIAEHVGD